jgi:hypothetical protein
VDCNYLTLFTPNSSNQKEKTLTSSSEERKKERENGAVYLFMAFGILTQTTLLGDRTS